MAKAAGKKTPRTWYSVSNKADEVPEIFIYDEIGGLGIWASELIAQLNKIDAPRIRVRIFSPGGFIDEGIAIFNAFRKHPAAIDVEIDSLVASIATVVAMSGDTIKIAENARMMIHDPWGGAVGTAEDMRKVADVMDIYRDSIVVTYMARTGLPRAEIEKLMADETWFTAEDAVEKGLADSIDSIAPASRAQNSFAGRIMNSLKHIPKDFESMFRSDKQATTQTLSPSMQQALKDGKPAELPEPLPARTTSDDSGHRDHGHQQEEPMNLDELKAQMKKAGVDVDALQATAGKMDTITAERDTARTELGEIKAAIGEHSPAEIKAAIEARAAARTASLDSIVASRRTLEMTGDSEDDVTAAKAAYEHLSDEQLKAEAAKLSTLASNKEQLNPAADDKETGAEPANKYINKEK